VVARSVLFPCLLLLSTSLLAQERTVVTTTQSITGAKLVALASDGGLTLTVDGKRTKVPAEQLVQFGEYLEPRRGPLILLSDGSWLVGDPIALSASELRVDTRLCGELSLSRHIVRGIVFRLPADVPERDRLLDRLQTRRDGGDLLLLANGDELTGQAIGQKYDEDDNEERLLFKLSSATEPTALALHTLAAIAFDAVLIDDATPRGRYVQAGLRDGSQLVVTSTATKDDHTQLLLASGAKLRIEQEALAEDLTFWQPINAGVVYLSDLPGGDYKHIPFLTQTWPYYRNRNCHGSRLRTAEALHFKGLGMHSTSRLAYELDADYRTFAVELALDQSAGTRGSVIYRVFTAGESGPFKPAYESPIIRGGDLPLPISVDLRGVKRIVLIVDFAERGDERDDANWLNARLLK
jgi:hypothetical protein